MVTRISTWIQLYIQILIHRNALVIILRSNTTSGDNVAIGHSALASVWQLVQYGYRFGCFKSSIASSNGHRHWRLIFSTTGSKILLLEQQLSIRITRLLILPRLDIERLVWPELAIKTILFGYTAGCASTAQMSFSATAGDALTTGSNNIVIGYDIDVHQTPEVTNFLLVIFSSELA